MRWIPRRSVISIHLPNTITHLCLNHPHQGQWRKQFRITINIPTSGLDSLCGFGRGRHAHQPLGLYVLNGFRQKQIKERQKSIILLPKMFFCRWSIQPSLGIAYMGLSPKSGTPLKWRFFLHEPRYHFCCISSDIQRKYSNMFIHRHFQVVYFPILDRITYIRYTSSSTVSYHSPNCVGPILGPRPGSPTGQWLLPALLLWQKVQEKDVQREFRHT